CAPGSPMICNDNEECTNDSCNPATGCVYTPRTGACTDDGIACTNDVCSAGLCTHPPKPDGTACADDGSVCPRHVCAAGACAHRPGNNGTRCDDGLFCTVSDTCQGGVCTGGPARNCADTNACTTDSCDEGTRTCIHQQVTGSCCGNGTVESGEECDDGNSSN